MDALSIISERSESTVHPLKPVYSSDQEHEERDPDTTLVESTLIPSSPMASKRSPGQLQHVCSSVDDFWTKIGEEQDDSPLDIKHLVLDLQDTGIRLFRYTSHSEIVLPIHPTLTTSFLFALTAFRRASSVRYFSRGCGMVARWAVDLLLFLQAEVDLAIGDGGYNYAEDLGCHGDRSSMGSTQSIPPWIGYLVWDIQMVLSKFGSVLNTVEGLCYKSPRDVRLLGNPLRSVRPECVEIFRIPTDELDRAYSEDIEALEG